MSIEAVILAGGFGSRLQSVVSQVPKPMAEVNGTPFLTYILAQLQRAGVSSAVVSVGYKAEVIVDYFSNNFRGMALSYAFEDSPLGTGGGVKRALSQVNGQNVMVINGDTYFNVDVVQLYHDFRRNEADVQMSLKAMQYFDRYGTVLLNDAQRVIGFREKQALDSGLINGGVYFFNRSVFEAVNEDTFSLEKALLEAKYNDLAIFGTTFDRYFIDIGIPADYAQAQQDAQQNLLRL